MPTCPNCNDTEMTAAENVHTVFSRICPECGYAE